MDLKIFTDGGSINNPGPAASAFVIFQDDRLLYKKSFKIGINSNNFAEYSALIAALEFVKKIVSAGKSEINQIAIFSDSNLMVNQLNGIFKVKNALIRDFIMKARVLEQEISKPISYTYVPREENRLADSLVKKELEGL